MQNILKAGAPNVHVQAAYKLGNSAPRLLLVKHCEVWVHES